MPKAHKYLAHYEHYPDLGSILVFSALGLGGAALGGAFSGAPKMPSMTAGQPKETATALTQTTQTEDQNKEQKASLLAKDFGKEPVKLGNTGLLGY